MGIERDLVYDLGLHKGEDTDYYLKRGFRVVAIEADPELAALNRQRFADEIDSGRLVLVEGAVSDTADDQVTFFRNVDHSVWGTVVKSWAERNSRLGTGSVEVTVRVVRLGELFERYGAPYYLKIDVEGMDLVALKTLLDSSARPTYVSIESEKIDFGRLQEEFDVFEQLGYDEFAVVEQWGAFLQRVPTDSHEGRPIDHVFEPGSSGLFGSDLRVEWVDRAEAERRYRSIFRSYRLFGDDSVFARVPRLRAWKERLEWRLRRPLPGWYDTHARVRSETG